MIYSTLKNNNQYNDNDINLLNKELATLLQTNNVEIIKKYITDNIIDIEEINNEVTPLIFALKHGISDAVLHLLIKHCKQINFELNDGETPLSLALSFKRFSIAKMLIDNGFNINYVNKFGENTLIYLIKIDEISPSSLSFLLNNNININAKDEMGKNALMYAIISNKVSLINQILEYYIMDNKFIINFLLMKRNQTKCTTDYISKQIHKEFHKININETDIGGSSALLLACDHRNEKIIKLLIKFGADVNIRDTYGNTPLLKSCRNGHLTRVKYLIRYGANIEATDSCLNTPLIVACKYAHYDIVKFLLENGANINARNINRDTALSATCLSLFFVTETTTTDIVRILVQYGADVNIPNKNKSTPLTLASEAGEMQIVEILLNHGANVNAIDDDGDTPLTLAREGHHNDIEELLIKYGAQLWLNKKKLILTVILLYLYIFYFLQDINLTNKRSKKIIKRYSN